MIKDFETGALRNFNFNDLLTYIPELNLLDCDIATTSFEKPIDSSNVMLICPYTDKPTKVWYVSIDEKGKTKKFRFSRKALAEKWWEAKDYIIK